MNIFNLFKKQDLKRSEKNIASVSDWKTVFGDGEDTKLSITGSIKDLPWVCLDKRSDAVSSLNFSFVKPARNGEFEVVNNHEIIDILNRPNSNTTQSNFIYTLSSQLDIFGETFIRIKRDEKTPQLFIIPKTQIEKIKSYDGLEVLRYKVNAGDGKYYTVEENDMVELKNPSMFGGVSGDGIIEKIRDIIDVQHTMVRMHKKMLQKSATFSAVIETEYDDKKHLELAKASFKQQHGGEESAYDIAMLAEGQKLVPFNGKSAKDMDFANMDRIYAQKILDAMGTPKAIFGNVEDKGLANNEQANQSFMKFTIAPIANQLFSQINEFLIPKLTNDLIIINLENIVPEDKEYQLKLAQASLSNSAWKTINEIRTEQGLDPVDGGDEIPQNGIVIEVPEDSGDDEPKKTVKTIKKGYNSALKKNKAVKKDIKSIDFSKKALPSWVKKGIIKDEEKKEQLDELSKQIMDGLYEAEHKTFISRNEVKASKISKLVEKVDKKLLKNVIANIRNQKNILNKTEYNNLLNEKQAVDEMERALEQPLIDIAVAEGMKAMALITAIDQFNPADEKLIKEVKRILRLHATAYTDTTARQLAKAVIDAGKDGLTAVEMESVVGEVFKKDFRHERIGQNLTFAVANEGSLNAYIQSDVVKTKVWHTAGDEKVCKLCGSMHGLEIDVHEKFFAGGSSTTIDGQRFDFFDDVKSGHAHANCRCKIRPGRIEVN